MYNFKAFKTLKNAFMKKQLILVIVFFLPVVSYAQNFNFSDFTIRNGKSVNQSGQSIYFQSNVNANGSLAKNEMNRSDKLGFNNNTAVLLSLWDDRDTKEFYKSKITKFTKMKKTGTVLAISGGVLTVAGIVMASNANWREQDNSNNYYSNSNQTYTTDADGVFGVLFIMAGVSMCTTGIILHTIGSKNIKRYTAKLNAVSINTIYRPQVKGLTLTYHF